MLARRKSRVEFYATAVSSNIQARSEPCLDEITRNGVYEVAGHKYELDVGIRRIKWIDARFALRLLDLGRLVTDNGKEEGQRYTLHTVPMNKKTIVGHAFSDIYSAAYPK